MPDGNAENAIKFQQLDYLCEILIKKVLFFLCFLTTPQPLNQTAQEKTLCVAFANESNKKLEHNT